MTGNGKTLSDPFGTALTTTFVAPSSNPSVINAALQNVLGTGPAGASGYSGSLHKAVWAELQRAG